MALDSDQVQTIIDTAAARPSKVTTQAGTVESRPLPELFEAQDRIARRSKRLRTVRLKTSAMVRTSPASEED